MLSTTQLAYQNCLGIPVMQFFTCPIHLKINWRMGWWLGSCRLISAQTLIRSTIREFSISSVLRVLEVLSCLYWHNFYQIHHSTLWWTVVRANWLELCQECRREVHWARYCSSCPPRSFFPFWRISWSIMPMTPLCYVLCHSQELELQ